MMLTNPPVHYCNWSLVYFRFQSVDNILKQVMKSKLASSEKDLSTNLKRAFLSFLMIDGDKKVVSKKPFASLFKSQFTAILSAMPKPY